ncbi:MAG: hypothetical protein IPP59_18245 [Betaproteobacteria bacterium]|nr:hypothetical protein [Candidatus Dechloromonas phosphorivorans]
MDAFVWTERFETGIEFVDRQHRQLVDTTNQLGELLLVGEGISDEELQALFHKLADYGRRHFSEEEALSAKVGLDPRHREQHAAHHRHLSSSCSACGGPVPQWRTGGGYSGLSRRLADGAYSG